jgi:hypothetical protein
MSGRLLVNAWRSAGYVFMNREVGPNKGMRLRWAMEKTFAVVRVVIALLAGEAFSQESSSVELAFTGDFLGAGSVAETEQGWFAVSRSPTGAYLEETRIEVSGVPNLCAGTATRIAAVDVDQPLFLVRGSSTFRSGPVDSVFEGRRFIYPAEGFSLQLSSGTWFGFQAYGSAAPAVGEVRVREYEIRMYQGTRTQTLAEFPLIDWDGPPQLVWAGDLDRDGNLDALLDLRTHYAGHHYVLFLSSRARSRDLVGRAAEFRVGGC